MSLIFGLPANVVYATAGIYALLVFATIVVWVLRLRTPGERYRELAARVDSWWWMIGAFTLAILFNQTVAIVFLGFIAYLALKEYLSLVPTRRIDRAVLLFAYLAIPGPDDDRLHAEPYGLAPRLGGQGQPGGGWRRAPLLPRGAHSVQRCRAILLGQAVWPPQGDAERECP